MRTRTRMWTCFGHSPPGRAGRVSVEITIAPSHLGPYLGDLGTGRAEIALPWIYAAPFYVE